MRLVLDTNVVASALLWDGAPSRLLRMGHSSEVMFFTSTPLLAELTDILIRPKFEKKIAASLFTVDQLVDLYAELAAFVRPLTIPRLAPDPDDDVVIGTALAARANFIVTGDRSLLSVVEYDGGQIVSVSEALRHIFSR
jgi:putative PIN family toxin of toxin-antitoxin system